MHKFEKLPFASFSSICRTCLMHSELFFIRDVNWEGTKLEKIIQDWTPLQFMHGEQLPQNMCKNCIKQMYYTYHFLSKCKSSEKVLINILHKRSEKDEVNNLESELILKEELIEDEDVNKKTDNSLLAEHNYCDQEDDNYCSNLDPAEIKTEASNIEQQEKNNPEASILSKIQSIKDEISKIRFRNKLRLRQIAKAQLVDYSCLPKRKNNRHDLRAGPPYICGTCDASYQTREELQEHKIEKKHRNLRFKCQYCPRKCESSRYEEHVRTHTGEKPNKCPTCGKAFNSKADMKRHVMTHMKDKPFNCRFCSKGFVRGQYLRDHERMHTGERLLCTFCGQGFRSYCALYSHEKFHKIHKGIISHNGLIRANRPFNCHICDKVLQTEVTLKAHVLLHGPKDFTCEICGNPYVSTRALKIHKKLVHPGYKFSCHLCDKEYSQEATLKDHLKSHVEKSVYTCEVCGKQFYCRGSLTQHRRIHTGDTTYQCKECLHICTNKRNLETHMRLHTGEKPFICEFCGKPFAQKANMKAHSRIHTSKKNLQCKLCDKAFFDNRGLKKHMAIHEKNGDSESRVVSSSKKQSF